MKKLLVVLTLFATSIFLVSCGGGSKTNDITDTGDTITDEDTVNTDSVSDTDSSGGDTEPTENPDSDNPDTVPDNPDSDDSDTANENPDNLPECSPTSSTPCKDLSSGLTWSAKAQKTMNLDYAVSYCDNLTEGWYSDWHLPTISELRTLIQNCPGTETGGSCGVTDNCLSWNECGKDGCSGCTYDESNRGQYSKFGDSGYFWSSSTGIDVTYYAWFVYFDYGNVCYDNKTTYYYVRCVR